jgi:hypothetical protein
MTWALIALAAGKAVSDGPFWWGGLVGSGFEGALPADIIGQVLGDDTSEDGIAIA